MNSIKRDKLILNHILEKYGKDDVLKYVKKIDEDFGSMLAGLNSTVFKDITDKHENSAYEKDEIRNWLNDHGITNFTFFYDNSLLVDQDVDLSECGLSNLPEFINFRECGENCKKFDISNNEFTQYRGLPKVFYSKKQPTYLNLSGNGFVNLYPYITSLGGYYIVNIKNLPNLQLHYEYFADPKLIEYDEAQRRQFIKDKMGK